VELDADVQKLMMVDLAEAELEKTAEDLRDQEEMETLHQQVPLKEIMAEKEQTSGKPMVVAEAEALLALAKMHQEPEDQAELEQLIQ
tara:strand:+ start:418 stop:678 length:261 start_codon:yes stop_codon:yes gene_type:complete